MTDDRKDYRCKVTLLLDDVTEEEATALFVDGMELREGRSMLVVMIEDPQPIEVQP